MKQEKLIRLLKTFDKALLPGLESHKKMAPKNRIHKDYEPEPINSVKSAVLILLSPDKQNGGFRFPLILRKKDNSVHSGQVSLPGGRYEKQDENLSRTALREAEEEIAANSDDVHLLNRLSPLYIPVSNFTVYPFIGFTQSPDYRPEPREVEDILSLPLKELVRASKETKLIYTRSYQVEAPFFVFEKIKIWGATAMILQEFKDILQLVGLSENL